MARRLRLTRWLVPYTLILFAAFALHGADSLVSESEDFESVPEVLGSRSVSSPTEQFPRRLPPRRDTSTHETPPGVVEAACPESGCIRSDSQSVSLLASAGAFLPLLPVDLTLLPSIAIGAGSRDNENIGIWLRGGGDHMTLGDVAQFDLNTFTLEIWFKWSGSGETASSGIYGVTAYPLIAKGGPGGESVNYFLGIDPLSQVLVADFQEHVSSEQPGVNHPIRGRTRISTSQWHHAVATYDGTCWQLYLDGQAETAGNDCPGGRPDFESRQPLSLGAMLDAEGHLAGSFEGVVDQMRIWNRALTQNEILDNRQADTLRRDHGLLGWWRFDEGRGDVAYDSSHLSLAATIEGGTWVYEGAPIAAELPVDDPAMIDFASGGVVRQPYVMLVTDTSAIIGWRSTDATDSVVTYGTEQGTLTSSAGDAAVVTDHFVTISGLRAGTKYFYDVGDSDPSVHAGGTANHFFVTAPTPGSSTPFTFWAVGDGVNGTSTQINVMNAMLTENGGN